MPKISAAVAERTRLDNPNIDLSTAENWLLRDELLDICKDAITKNLGGKHFSYPSGFSGDPSMVEAVASFLNTHFHPVQAVKTDQIATAPGAASCLDALLYTICDPGDGVLVPGPYWNGFDFQFRVRASVTPVLVNCPDFKSTLTTELIPALQTAVEQATCPVRALVLTNPHNPFGQCYPREVLEACLKFCEEHKIHYISDEVYALSTIDSADSDDLTPFISALSLDPSAVGCSPGRVHVIWSISKDFGSSGIRLGCTISQHNPEVIVGVTLASNTQTSSLAAIYTTAVLSSDQTDWLVKKNQERLSSAYGMIAAWLRANDIEYIPVRAGVYVFAKLGKQIQSWDEETALVQKCKDAGVLISAGRSYHGIESEKGWARITFAVEPDTLQRGLERLSSALDLRS
ncbi:PLP-dependent transferase [Aspergillus floccosus]